MPLEPVDDPTVADWIGAHDTDWWTVACQGPPGFEAMATVWFDQGDADRYRPDIDVVRHVLETLTGDPTQRLLFALWDGWGEPVRYSTRRPRFWDGWLFARRGPRRPAGRLRSPTVDLDGYRGYFLYRGTTPELGSWGRSDDGTASSPPPAWVWPEDRSWFLAADVDPVWFSVSGPRALVARVLADPLLVSTPAAHGDLPPLDDW